MQSQELCCLATSTMKRFYELYPNAENLPQPVADSSVSNRPQAVDDSEQLVFCIPWGHNRTSHVTPTDDFKFKEIQSFEKYMEMAFLPIVKADTSIEQLSAWLGQTDPTNP